MLDSRTLFIHPSLHLLHDCCSYSIKCCVLRSLGENLPQTCQLYTPSASTFLIPGGPRRGTIPFISLWVWFKLMHIHVSTSSVVPRADSVIQRAQSIVEISVKTMPLVFPLASICIETQVSNRSIALLVRFFSYIENWVLKKQPLQQMGNVPLSIFPIKT